MFMTPGESLVPWVLLLEIIKMMINIQMIINNQIIKISDTTTGENQSEDINNRIILQFSTICDIIDVSSELNKNVSIISLKLILSFLPCISLDVEKNLFT